MTLGNVARALGMSCICPYVLHGSLSGFICRARGANASTEAAFSVAFVAPPSLPEPALTQRDVGASDACLAWDATYSNADIFANHERYAARELCAGANASSHDGEPDATVRDDAADAGPLRASPVALHANAHADAHAYDATWPLGRVGVGLSARLRARWARRHAQE